jgi:hypothetical protein
MVVLAAEAQLTLLPGQRRALVGLAILPTQARHKAITEELLPAAPQILAVVAEAALLLLAAMAARLLVVMAEMAPLQLFPVPRQPTQEGVVPEHLMAVQLVLAAPEAVVTQVLGLRLH